MDIIGQVKALLGITDDLQNDLLSVIKDLTESHFLVYTGASAVPDSLDFIIVEVMVKRFNRIGSEGMKSQKMEGFTMEFDLSDFDHYKGLLARHYPSIRGEAGFKML